MPCTCPVLCYILLTHRTAQCPTPASTHVRVPAVTTGGKPTGVYADNPCHVVDKWGAACDQVCGRWAVETRACLMGMGRWVCLTGGRVGICR